MAHIGLRLSIIASVATLFGSMPATVGAQNSRNRSEVDTSFVFDRTGTVSIGNGSAIIVVTGWDQGTIHIRARADEGSWRLDVSPRQVTIAPTRSSDDMTIEIQVPRGVKIEAGTNSGDITVRGTRGDVDAQTSSGDIHISDARDLNVASLSGDVVAAQITGTVSATTNNGDLEISDAHGPIEATAVSGDIEIRQSTAKVVRAGNTSGDIGFSGTIETQGRYEFTTHSGDMELVIPRDASAQIGVTTWNGSLDSDFPITLKPGAVTGSRDFTKHYDFTIGAGSAHIRAEAFSGDIAIRSRGGR